MATRALCRRLSELQKLLFTQGASTCRTFTTGRRQWDEARRSPGAKIDIEAVLSTPSWSVASLLPPTTTSSSSNPDTPSITSTQLRHLLRLSALPPPKDADDEARMLSTLSSQLHLVREIQKVDTTGVEPLRSIRDETEAGEMEAEVGLETLKEALGKEEVRGKFHKRLRRVKEGTRRAASGQEDWDVLGTAERKAGRHFVVEGGRPASASKGGGAADG